MRRFISIVLIFLVSCSANHSGKNDNFIARVHKKNLSRSELSDLIKPGTNAKDSISISRKYIDNWILQQLILEKAEANLPAGQKDFTKQLENYRNSLIIYEYETNLIKQNLDTVVTDQEIDNYYEKNKQNFELKDNIIKVNFVIIQRDKSVTFPVKTYLNSFDPDDKDRLAEYCKKSAVNYYLEDQWMLFNELLNVIPIDTYNEKMFLENNRYIELQDSSYKYFVRFFDFKIKESTSPLSFEKENIRNIIINKRKLEIIERMHRKIFDDAVKNDDFEIYQK
ncbi:MAG: hypothetical protein NT175_14475 [Bacteroidetes bacterium]|nr:hypothetical protein [Bacteroidota bacterium]